MSFPGGSDGGRQLKIHPVSVLETCQPEGCASILPATAKHFHTVGQDASRFGKSHGECVICVTVVRKSVITKLVRCYNSSLAEGGGDVGRDSGNVITLS